MQISFEWKGQKYETDISQGMDISLSFGPTGDNPNAFGIPFADIQPIKVGDFVGSVAEGSGANCDIIRFCAHGNTTHTECMGHITREHEFVGDCIKAHFILADLVSVELREMDSDMVLNAAALNHLPDTGASAVVLRSLPNLTDKKNRNWSGTRPPFFTVEAMQTLVDHGYEHLLTDLPSVDAEEDDGALQAHHVWWQYPLNPRKSASITELIYVPDEIEDGLYLLNLQFSKIQSDASPSKPILFRLNQKK